MIYLLVLLITLFLLYLIFPLPTTKEYFINMDDTQMKEDDSIIKDNTITDDAMINNGDDASYMREDEEENIGGDGESMSESMGESMGKDVEPPILTYDLSTYHCNSYRNYKLLLPDSYVKKYKGHTLKDDDVACIPNNIDPSRNFTEKDVVCVQLPSVLDDHTIQQCTDYFAQSNHSY